MGVATKPRSAVVFLMLLMGVSLVLPAEDVLDAVYDESEAVPSEVIPLLLIAVPRAVAQTTQAPLSSLHTGFCVPSPFTLPQVRDTDAHRSADRPALWYYSAFCFVSCADCFTSPKGGWTLTTKIAEKLSLWR